MRATCNDLEVAWFEVGRGDALVLVHGLADDHRAWRRALPDLALRHRVVLYDLRGHGQTSLGEPDETLRQLGEDLVALMDAIGLDSAALRSSPHRVGSAGRPRSGTAGASRWSTTRTRCCGTRSTVTPPMST